MFLKKRNRTYKNFLLKRFFIDIWGYYLKKKKFNNKRTLKFLEFFIRYVIPRLKKSKFYKKKRRLFSRQLKKFYSKENRKPLVLKRKTTFRNIPKSVRKVKKKLPKRQIKQRINIKKIWFNQILKKPLNKKKLFLKKKTKFILKKKKFKKNFTNLYKKFVGRCLLKFSSWKRSGSNFLPSFWHSRMRDRDKMVSKLRSKFWKGKKTPYFKYTYLKRPKDYRITRLIGIILQQHHYGFSTLTSFRMYLKKHQVKVGSWKYKALGIEGMLSNQLCKTTLVPEIRVSYVLIRSGAIMINNKINLNPRKILYVGDEIKLAPIYRKLITRYYLLWLKRKKVWQGIPNYFDFNLKLMAYKIWRRPTKFESTSLSYYPFHKTGVDWGKVSKFNYKI